MAIPANPPKTKPVPIQDIPDLEHGRGDNWEKHLPLRMGPLDQQNFDRFFKFPLPVVPPVKDGSLSCISCGFWQPAGNLQPAATGICRKNTPKPSLELVGAANAVWPTTNDDDYCMEHSLSVKNAANPVNEFLAAFRVSGDNNDYRMFVGGSKCISILYVVPYWEGYKPTIGASGNAPEEWNNSPEFFYNLFARLPSIVVTWSELALGGCDTCENWGGDHDDTTGECLRYAPAPKLNDGETSATALWPVTSEHDWCAYYRLSPYKILKKYGVEPFTNTTPHLVA